MSQQISSSSSGRGREIRHRRLRPVALVGLVLMVVVPLVLVLVGLGTKEIWTFFAAFAAFTVGLVVLGQALAPGRSSFRAGTTLWQNTGVPGGGGGAA